jgi:excisionase family DNA binding protein
MRTLKKQSSEAAAPSPRQFHSVTEVARMFGMSPMTVYRAIAAGEFPAVRVRGRLIVPARAIEEMVEAALADQGLVDAAGWVPEQHGRGV